MSVGDMCQCPSSGFSYFYDIDMGTVLEILGGVNALVRASPISTLKLKSSCMTELCVNALVRASPISTVPSGRPQK